MDRTIWTQDEIDDLQVEAELLLERAHLKLGVELGSPPGSSRAELWLIAPGRVYVGSVDVSRNASGGRMYKAVKAHSLTIETRNSLQAALQHAGTDKAGYPYHHQKLRVLTF